MVRRDERTSLRRREIRKLLLKQPSLTNAQLAEKLDVNEKTIYRDLEKMHDGLIKRVQKDKRFDRLLQESMGTFDESIEHLKELYFKALKKNDIRTANAIKKNVTEIEEKKTNLLVKLGIRKEQPIELEQKIVVKWKDKKLR